MCTRQQYGVKIERKRCEYTRRVQPVGVILVACQIIAGRWLIFFRRSNRTDKRIRKTAATVCAAAVIGFIALITSRDAPCGTYW